MSGKKDLWGVDGDEWYREIDVNLNGVFHTCKAVAPVLIERGNGGRIINISSLAGRVGAAAVRRLHTGEVRGHRANAGAGPELAPHKVTVNAVCPGSTDTDMMDSTFRRTGERIGHSVRDGETGSSHVRAPRPSGANPGDRRRGRVPRVRQGGVRDRASDQRRRRDRDAVEGRLEIGSWKLEVGFQCPTSNL